MVNQRRFSFYKTMLTCFLSCRKNTESKKPKVVKSVNRKIMVTSDCAI